MRKIGAETLHDQAEKAILEHYQNTGESKLESEEELAEKLGVSRITVREAMNSLAQKGYLTRKKGKGNFLHKSVMDTKMRFDGISDFHVLIEEIGYTPTLKRNFLGKSTPTAEIADKLNCGEGDLVLNFLWHYLADDQSAMRIYAQVPEKLVVSMPPEREDQGDDLINYRFFHEQCNQDINHYISFVDATVNPEINRAFGVDEKTPLICLKQFYYNLEDECIAYSDIYFNPRITELSVVSSYD
jgi:GntR family transcriptional regulator